MDLGALLVDDSIGDINDNESEFAQILSMYVESERDTRIDGP